MSTYHCSHCTFFNFSQFHVNLGCLKLSWVEAKTWCNVKEWEHSGTKNCDVSIQNKTAFHQKIRIFDHLWLSPKSNRRSHNWCRQVSWLALRAHTVPGTTRVRPVRTLSWFDEFFFVETKEKEKLWRFWIHNHINIQIFTLLSWFNGYFSWCLVFF